MTTTGTRTSTAVVVGDLIRRTFSSDRGGCFVMAPGWSGLTCTRRFGHTGRHAATAGDRLGVVKVWGDES